jgi:maleamate amidohydrolase
MRRTQLWPDHEPALLHCLCERCLVQHGAYQPEPGDVVIFKERASGFFGTPLVAHLTQLGIDSLIVCGESTSGCVRASCVDAYSLGYHVSIVEETVFDRSMLSHKVNLFDLHHKYADVMHVDQVIAHLEALAVKKAS